MAAYGGHEYGEGGGRSVDGGMISLDWSFELIVISGVETYGIKGMRSYIGASPTSFDSLMLRLLEAPPSPGEALLELDADWT